VDVAVGGRGVGVSGRRVGVGVGARLVGVGGIWVCVAVGVATRIGVSVGASVPVGDGSVSNVGVALMVAVAGGLGVLVGVGVTAGGRATEESRGQVQLMVIIAATTAGASSFLVSLFKGRVPFLGASCPGRALAHPRG
jgi:hypothetical protein